MTKRKHKRATLNEPHHEACALALMKDFGIHVLLKRALILLIKQIYDRERFPHCLIILSVGEFIHPDVSLKLRCFLQTYGRRKPTRTKENMLETDEYD